MLISALKSSRQPQNHLNIRLSMMMTIIWNAFQGGRFDFRFLSFPEWKKASWLRTATQRAAWDCWSDSCRASSGACFLPWAPSNAESYLSYDKESSVYRRWADSGAVGNHVSPPSCSVRGWFALVTSANFSFHNWDPSQIHKPEWSIG